MTKKIAAHEVKPSLQNTRGVGTLRWRCAGLPGYEEHEHEPHFLTIPGKTIGDPDQRVYCDGTRPR